MTRADTPEQLFADALARNPSRPFVTYYDDSTGERSELSLKSLANWVAKTYHLLVDQLGLDVGAAAYVELPAHWISTAPILGAFAAGLRFDTDPGASDVAFVTAETAARATGVPDVFAISTSTAAIGFRDAPPAGTEDFVAAVRPQPDAWAGVRLR
ncbi:MAG TPA: TIGR03089 family protein, partial [Jatrophihabitantaceae bacterium]